MKSTNKQFLFALAFLGKLVHCGSEDYYGREFTEKEVDNIFVNGIFEEDKLDHPLYKEWEANFDPCFTGIYSILTSHPVWVDAVHHGDIIGYPLDLGYSSHLWMITHQQATKIAPFIRMLEEETIEAKYQIYREVIGNTYRGWL